MNPCYKFKEDDAKEVAQLIVRVLTNMGDKTVKQQVAQDVKDLTAKFPVPGLDL